MTEPRNRYVRNALVSALNHSRALSLVPRLFRDSLPILTLHGVAADHESQVWQPTWGRCEPERLDQILGILSRYYRFIGLDEATDMLAGEIPFEPGCMALTFDDGYRNNITTAREILEAHDAPLNIFVTTRNVLGGVPYWIDRIDYALQRLDGNRWQFRSACFSHDLAWANRDELAAGYKAFRQELMAAYDDDVALLTDVEQMTAELEAAAGSSLHEVFEDDPYSSLIRPEELSALPQHVHVGSHTETHIRVDRVSAERLRQELVSSKRAIEEHRGHCHYFCYPTGAFDAASAREVEACHYRAAFTGQSGTNRPGDDLFTLKRISLPESADEPEVLYHLARNLIYPPTPSPRSAAG